MDVDRASMTPAVFTGIGRGIDVEAHCLKQGMCSRRTAKLNLKGAPHFDSFYLLQDLRLKRKAASIPESMLRTGLILE